MTETSPDRFKEQLARAGYIAETDLATVLILMRRLGRPLLVEGEAGVGKTEIARALSIMERRKLIRLQCHEGLDTCTAVYEWNYSRQLLSIQSHDHLNISESPNIFSEEFLLERPLLQSIRQSESPILLIDEIDRADEAFEAFLLELLSDFQITIPEIGTVEASSIPLVILTSNGTRDLSDALRRRCLYHYLDYPDPARELAIVESHQPGISHRLADQVTSLVHQLRQRNLAKSPGVAEVLDWCAALTAANVSDLTTAGELLASTRGCIFKHREDFDAYGAEDLADLARQSA